MEKSVSEGICSTTESSAYLELSDSLSQAAVVGECFSPSWIQHQLCSIIGSSQHRSGQVMLSGVETTLLMSQRENAGSCILAGSRTKCSHAFTLKRDRLDYYFCKTKKPRDKQEKTRESDIWKVTIEPGEMELQGLRTYIRGEKG